MVGDARLRARASPRAVPPVLASVAVVVASPEDAATAVPKTLLVAEGARVARFLVAMRDLVVGARVPQMAYTVCVACLAEWDGGRARRAVRMPER